MTIETRVVGLLTAMSMLALFSGVEASGEELEKTAAGLPAEGELAPFMGEPRFDNQKVFTGQRLPNVVVATDGTVLAVWGWPDVRVRRSEDGGVTWGDVIPVHVGIHDGGATVDEANGHIFVFSYDEKVPCVFRSRDHGQTWSDVSITIIPDLNGHVPRLGQHEHGITLKHGPHAGRLLRPARYVGGPKDSKQYQTHYNMAVYSDDGGVTWKTSDPFPAFGTGEGAVAELSDGTVYYNSRRHWSPDPETQSPLRRWTAWSYDGGHSWTNLSICEVLPDGTQGSNYGLFGGLTRLPVKGRDILVFSNIESDGARLARHHGTVWASFDGGKSWPVKRLVDPGTFGYSSVNAGRPGTASEGWIYLGYEGSEAMQVARFNLGWILDVGDGKAVLTGDGTPPDGLR